MRSGSFRRTGRILYLTEDPLLIARQLAGENLGWPLAAPLRDDISNDEITPVWTMYHYDQRLARHALVGLVADGGPVVAPGALAAGGFEVSVSGRRRGRGSSREHAPYAELCAGIRLIFARSFEHIYRKNCTNLGILTSTNFALLEALERGESLPLEEFLDEADVLDAQVIRHGGIFPFSAARAAGRLPSLAVRGGPRAMTLAEKIFARHWQGGAQAVSPGEVGFVRADLRVSHEYITPMAASFLRLSLGPEVVLHDPDSILLFRDHLTFVDEVLEQPCLLAAAQELEAEQKSFAATHGLRLIGEQSDRRGSIAISHNYLLEQCALPGQLVVSADSHAPHMGALGCLALGVGATALACSWLTGDLRVEVPATVNIELRGRFGFGVAAKDLMLHLLRLPDVRAGCLSGKLVEYTGEALAQLEIGERATLTNMATELGALSSLIAPDARTQAWLLQRGVARDEAEALCAQRSDPDAVYARTFVVDVAALRPMVALPGDPGNGVELAALPEEVAIQRAFIGSCTASKASDMDMVAEVLHACLQQGRRVDERVELIIQLGSVAVREHCARRGHLALFARCGARVLEPACGACCKAGPGVSLAPDEVTVSAGNRNYPGRSGPGPVYLASPYTVAASAIAGRIVPYMQESAAGLSRETRHAH